MQANFRNGALGMIHPISPDLLDETFLHERVYPDLESTYYWTRSWDPDFYVALARAGFISISHEHPTFGTLLLPEIQNAYAVLDWDDLHVSRKLRKLLRSGRLEPEGLELRIVGPCDRVIERLIAYHGDATWLTPPYRALLSQLPTGECTNFALTRSARPIRASRASARGAIVSAAISARCRWSGWHAY
jgi:hypothetical protein